MNNAAPALLALLLVCTLPAMAVTAANPASTDTSAEQHTITGSNVITSSDPVTTENTTNRLLLEGELRSSYSSASLDFGTTLAIRNDALQNEYETFQFETEFENGTDAERSAIIEDEYERISDRINYLKDREQAAVSAHANGTLSDGQLLQTLVRISSESDELEASLGELNQYENEVSDVNVDDRSLRGELAILNGPIRHQIVTTMQKAGPSNQPPENVLMETSESGILLAMVDEGTYIREVTRYDNRDITLLNRFGNLPAAREHTTELYPWAFDEQRGQSSQVYNDAQLYGISVEHSHGRLDTYIGGGTGAVYHEAQTLVLNQLPAEQLEQTWTNDSVKLAVNQTPTNGPIEVTLTDETTDEPVNATIRVNDTPVGYTEQDGTLWLVPPHDDYELAAQTPETTVNASISASPPR